MYCFPGGRPCIADKKLCQLMLREPHSKPHKEQANASKGNFGMIDQTRMQRPLCRLNHRVFCIMTHCLIGCFSEEDDHEMISGGRASETYTKEISFGTKTNFYERLTEPVIWEPPGSTEEWGFINVKLKILLADEDSIGSLPRLTGCEKFSLKHYRETVGRRLLKNRIL